MRIGKKTLLSLLFGLMFNIPFAWATPPYKLDVRYDAGDKALKVDIEHASHELSEHYIRKITVYKNSEEPKIFYYSHQPSPQQFTLTIPFEAKNGDKIRITASCSEGGSKDAETTVSGVVEDKTTKTPVQVEPVKMKEKPSGGY